MAVVKNMMVRVGADFSSFLTESVKATTAAQKWASGTRKAFSDAQKGASGLSNVSDQVSRASSAWSRAAGMLKGALTATAITAFVKKSIDAASDLVEVQNVVDKAFGSMADRANEFGKTAIKQFGLTELQAKQFSANFMAMGQSMGLAQQQAADMAIDLAGRAGDVASFFNLDQDEAYTKLKAIYTGETESLKELGVVMTQDNLRAFALSQGIATSYNEMSQAEKVALRYNYVMNALSYAQGDFASTSHQWANNVRVLKNQFSTLIGVIGKGFIAVLNPVVTVLNTIMGALVEFANGVSEVFSMVFGSAKTALSASSGSVDVSGLSGALEDVGGAASDATKGVDGVGKATKGAASAAKELARSVMGFDKITKLTASSSSSSGGSGGSGGGSGSGGGGTGAGVSGGLVSGGDSVLGDVVKQTSALSEGFQKLKDFLSSLDFAPLQKSWERLKEAGGRLVDVITGGLKWGLENVLAPLAKWTIEDALPAGLDVLSGCFNVLAAALEALDPWGKKIWDGFLAPLAKWAGDTVVATLEGLADALNGIADAISAHPQAFSTVVTFVAALAGANAAIGIVTGIAGGLAAIVEGASGLATALSMASGPLALIEAFAIANPIGAIAVAIAGAVTAGVLLYQNWDTICTEAGKLRDAIGNAFTAIKDGIGEAVISIGKFLADLVQAPLTGLKNFGSVLLEIFSPESLTEAVESGVNLANGILRGIGQVFDALPDWIKTHIFALFISAFKIAFGIHSPASNPELLEAAGNVGKGILNGIGAVFTNIGKWVGDNILTPIKSAMGGAGAKLDVAISLVKSGWTSLKDFIGDKVNAVVTFAKKSGQKLKDLIGDSTSAVVTFAKKKGQKLGDLIGDKLKVSIGIVKGWKGSVAKALGLNKLASKFSIKLPKVSVTWSGRPIPLPHFHVKWNARGGILDGAQIFGMAGNTLLGGGERGREAVLPLESNTGWMDTLADKVAARVGGQGGSGQPIRVQVILDGKVVAESTVRQLRNQARGGNYPLAGLV